MFSGSLGSPFLWYVSRWERDPLLEYFYQEVNYPKVSAQELMKAADLQYMQAEIIAQELSMGCPEGKSRRIFCRKSFWSEKQEG